VEGGTVIVPYSSGEIYALRASNGAVAWGDQLVRTGRLSSVATMNNIAGQPVIDRGRVFAASHSGRMVSLDLRTGERVWERNLASLQSPWVAGDFVYVVTVDAEVVCLSRNDGRIRWVQALPRYRNPDSKGSKGPISWYGPVLAGDRLVLLSSHSEAVSISPYTGDILGQMRLGNAAAAGPVVADGVLYILTDDAKLTALK
jgi:outer membrane protein assembly factor BamB